MKKLVFFCAIFSTCLFDSFSQENAKEIFSESTFSGLKIRNIGPALMSGRISDIVLHPDNPNTWYVAVGSGGVWKTVNAGTTWEPIFDDQGSYSIGCLAIDKNNPHIVWVGTGENVGGRHVAYGDGIYKSSDGGKSWQNMGLKKSYHISKILIHPKNPDIIWVAAQGMLWNKGDERGVYKSTDGGKTWKKTLGDDEWTGATDIVIDPRDPDMLYAATWQRHRTVAAYMGGGPGSGIHKSTDGGETWRELTKGLPESNMGKIGLAISPQYPDVIYAAIELDRRTGGVYRSADRGESWKKQSEAVSGGTGPHYYQELYASPHNFDRLYLVDVRMQVSEDGGKTFTRMKEEFKHPDNHSLTFRDDDPDYLLVGTDGGIYESFDLGESWRFIPNLPVTQFYKVAVDDAEPFYNVYGGTQDNNTQGGPSRTDNHHGIRNADWFIILFGDGHQPATEPGNPDIVYAEWQEGNLVRVDRKTGEIVYVQPQPDEGEPHERFNWDAPILVSPHSPTRLYYASYRVWRSDNRGDSWKTISDDLTRGQERITLPIMGKQQSWDEPWDLYAMSNYNTITSLAESPLQEGLIYAGTDDGIIQVTEDGGENWRKIEVGSMPGVPATAFVNDIKADLFDVNTVYICLDNHKFGDLQPYIMKSTDKGKSWKSIRGNIPDRTLTWRMVQDHVKPELLFAGTEFGIYFTIDGGKKWAKLSGDVPVISFRDLAIQRRENDLVGASFGRGFFIFDDYTVLRHISEEQLKQDATLFPVKDAWWHIQRPVLSFGEGKGSQGAGYYVAPNPPFGAVFTYYLPEDLKTRKVKRKEMEEKLREEDMNIPWPGWDALEAERREQEPVIWMTVSDMEGNVIRRLKGPAKKGFHRIAWDLKYASPVPVDGEEEKGRDRGSFMVAPGKYMVSIASQVDGKISLLNEPREFNVVRLHEGSLEGADPEVTAAFWKDLDETMEQLMAVSRKLASAVELTEKMQVALAKSETGPGKLDTCIFRLREKLLKLDEKLNGYSSKADVGEKNPPNVRERLNVAITGTSYSTYGPTSTHRKSLRLAQKDLKEIIEELKEITGVQIPAVIKKLNEAGAPWIEGVDLP